MRLQILEASDKPFDNYACDNPKCDKPATKKVLKITEDMTNRLHICFNCLKKGITLNLDVTNK